MKISEKIIRQGLILQEMSADNERKIDGVPVRTL